MFNWNVLSILWALISTSILLVYFLIYFIDKSCPTILKDLFFFGKLCLNNDIDNLKNSYSHASLLNWIYISKRYFFYFYLFAILFQLMILVTYLFCLNTQCSFLKWSLDIILTPTFFNSNSNSLFWLVILIQSHLIRRLYESYYIAKPSKAQMNIIHFLLGLAFYASLGFILLQALIKTGKLVLTFPSFLAFVGIALNVIGQYIQYQSHYLLSKLRSKTKKEEKEINFKEYYIPKGGLFELISCPNYFGEMLIYCGFFIISNFDPLWHGLLFWIITSHSVNAFFYHKWYRKTFLHNYPAKRKALIPFIF